MTIWTRLLGQPVLVGLIGAALALFGLAAVFSLPIRSSPIIPAHLIDISTDFPGADAATIDRFVTLPLESAVAALPGVKYVTGTTQVANSDVQAFLADGASADTVFGEVLAAVNAARSTLPAGILAPTLKLVGNDQANQELNITVLFPPSLSLAQITAFATTNLIPRFETVPGIGPVYLYTGTPSLQVRMDPVAMQALGITPASLAQTLSVASAVGGGGVLRNHAVMMPLNDAAQLTSPADFNDLPVDTRNGVSLPLRSVAHVGVDFSAGADVQWYNDKPAVYIAAGIAPDGNIIDVARDVHKMVATLKPMMPPGIRLEVTYDQSTGVSRSLHDLALTLVITILLVGGIVRLSLGTMRAALAPFVAIMLSLLGATVVMEITGQTFNLFTIIALVLAVGLVVDDAIVVVEDVFRRVAEGDGALAAAQASVTRLAPVLAAISSTLVVAFLPLGFLSGLTASLFRPFALVLISAFVLSLGISLTIVPSIAMWASRRYDHRDARSVIDRLRDVYVRMLTPALRVSPMIAVAVVLVAGLCFGLARVAPSNLDPAPDGLDVNIFASAPNGSSIDYMKAQAADMEAVLHKTEPGRPEWLDASEQSHALFGGYTFDTPAHAGAAVVKLTDALGTLDGVSAYVNQDSGLPGSEDLPVSVNISGQTDASRLLDIADKIQTQAYATGDFDFVQINPGEPQYQYRLVIDRTLASRLGITDGDITDAVSAAMAGGNLGQVSINGAAMNLVTALPARSGREMLLSMPVKTASGAVVPLGTVVSLTGAETPNALGSWQGLPSVNIQAQQKLGVPLSRALSDLRTEFMQAHAPDLSFGYSGPSEIYRESNQQNIKLFALGLAGLFFLLAAQFQSLRDPFVVITTVPLASLGPLVLFMAGGATLNIVTEIALLTVWGLIARQGILFVQVAHEGKDQGLAIQAAALRAARLRFRPILMITLALIGGAVPLILSSGPQSVIRYDLGVVLATGMSSGFVLSLFAVPAMYCLFHRSRHAD
ncbi:MAG: efflux RND transporter permease subunit [Acidocella sp.]|nr:efflux RND transporter permease subunit [Acidocella sp.]